MKWEPFQSWGWCSSIINLKWCRVERLNRVLTSCGKCLVCFCNVFVYAYTPCTNIALHTAKVPHFAVDGQCLIYYTPCTNIALHTAKVPHSAVDGQFLIYGENLEIQFSDIQSLHSFNIIGISTIKWCARDYPEIAIKIDAPPFHPPGGEGKVNR